MKLTPQNQKRINDEIIPGIVELHGKTGEPVSLHQLPLWDSLSRSTKIKIGRKFKKMVMQGEVDGIRFVGIRKDNHSTYIPVGAGGGLGGFFRRLFK